MYLYFCRVKQESFLISRFVIKLKAKSLQTVKPTNMEPSVQKTGHCINGRKCNPFNGFCHAGCKTGYYGSQCKMGTVVMFKDIDFYNILYGMKN